MSVLIAQNLFGRNAGPVTVVGSDPAANTEFSQTVPAGELWLLLSVSVALVQGATQTPQPVLTITDGTNTIYQSYGATGAQAVSTTCQYNWAVGLTLAALVGATTGVKAVAPLPADLLLEAGSVIASSTVGKGANSNYGAPVFRVLKGVTQ
jgi:hypothetical protein